MVSDTNAQSSAAGSPYLRQIFPNSFTSKAKIQNLKYSSSQKGCLEGIFAFNTHISLIKSTKNEENILFF